MKAAQVKWFVAFVVSALFVLPVDFADAGKSRRRCLRKRSRCLSKCVRKARRTQKRCIRRVTRRRGKCIRQAWRVGKKCIRKLTCAAADKCYEKCRNHPTPVVCHVKKNCAKMRSSCYKTCQYSPGERLKLCLSETTQKFKQCAKGTRQVKDVCQAACVTCN